MFLPGEPRDGGAWCDAVYGVAQSDTTEVTYQQERKGQAINSPSGAEQVYGYLPVLLGHWRTSLVAQMVKRLPKMQETQVQFLGQEDPLEKEMATYSSTPAWKIQWTEECDRL